MPLTSFLEGGAAAAADVGDWLTLSLLMGAYTSVMSSTFNGFSPTSICYAVGPELRCPGRRKGVWQ